ncbi:Acyl-CoA-binding protein ACBP [Penicillium bovifimosum]|uniref:Acyl-CoA-binding protein ACBP n=1 Tax=Penicillium bovifimosum TaxID=126998 RepID=A0A9W9H0U5_9EURO|nr:Acyl-CoA-binding protein ACBP [Penicillium bovifimosum]KAJ5135534.1 Acyl-CoA-binding protein ACBP [Penicillium bovifimosum]
MSDSVDRVFVHALNTVKRIPRTGTARPPAAQRLALYGLYKQSMEGDVEGVMDRPIGNTPEVHAECEKWDAWYAQRDLSRTEAKRRYISTLINTMHEYASQTPDARELVSELEFVWDQIKYNASSSSGSGRLNTVGVPPLSRSAYGSIGSRLAQSEEFDRPDRRTDTSRRDRDSRLRVLSPVSQPEEEEYYRRRMRIDDDQRDEEDDEEDEEFEEARDSLYEAQADDDDRSEHSTTTHSNTYTNSEHSHRRPPHRRNTASGVSLDSSRNGNVRDSASQSGKDTRWRRRVEQALTKMTAEIAAVREQMEVRTLAQRRRSGLWAWLKWIVWIAVRQILFDIAMLGGLLIYMRLKGDRRVENRLKTGWAAVKARLGRIKLLKVIDMPILP